MTEQTVTPTKLEVPITPSELHDLVSGALYDFMGFMTTRQTPVTLSSNHPVPPAIDALTEFMAARNINPDSANVDKWHERLSAYQSTQSEPFQFPVGNVVMRGDFGRAPDVPHFSEQPERGVMDVVSDVVGAVGQGISDVASAVGDAASGVDLS